MPICGLFLINPEYFANATFTLRQAQGIAYDGDGKRVKSVLTTNLGSSTTIFVGSHYEITNGVVTKYYFAGGQRIAMRTNGTLSYLISDHLGSTSLVTDSSGNVLSQQKYKAWGETRYSSGSMSTRYQYTGQFSYASEFGLLFYNARMYDPQLGRFASADSIVPGGAQGYDRYAYVNNSPPNYTDPTGHCAVNGDNWCFDSDDEDNGGSVIPIENPTPSTPAVTGTPPPPTILPFIIDSSSTSTIDQGAICSTPMPGWRPCSNYASTPHPAGPNTPAPYSIIDDVIGYGQLGDAFDFTPDGMPPFSEAVDDVFASLPRIGIPAIFDVGRWYSLEKPIIIYGTSLIQGGPIIAVPKILFTGNSDLGIPALFPTQEYH